MKKKIALVLGLILLGGMFYWFSTHSFIEVSVVGDVGGAKLTYAIRNQNAQQPQTFVSQNTKVRKIVAKGDYQVSVGSGDRSSFTVVETGRFLGTTRVSASLEQESFRKFTGYNPSACMAYPGDVLISYPCEGYYSDAIIHQPATDNTPTYTTDNLLTDLSALIEGTASNDPADYMLLRTGSSGEGQAGGEHLLLPLRADLKVTGTSKLTDLLVGEKYFMQSHGAGFITYNASFNHALFYSSASSAPSNIELDQPREQNMDPVSIDFGPNSQAMLFIDTSSSEKGGEAKYKYEVVVKADGRSIHKVLDGAYHRIMFCGTKKVCLLTDNRMEVYDINPKDLSYSYAVAGVSGIAQKDGGLLVVAEAGVLDFNVNERSGFYSIRFGKYGFNSISPVGSNTYLVSVTDDTGRVAVLAVNSSSKNKDSIDQKVLDLQALNVIEFVSAYDRELYIAADIGEPIYNSTTKRLGYDPEVKKSAAEKINQEIDRLGIDRSYYTINSNVF